MKKSKISFSSILIVLFLIWFSNINAQRDSVANSRIYSKIKPLQFGNDFDKEPELNLLIPNKLHKTEYYKYYDYKYLVYDPVKDPKRLAYNTGLFIGGALTAFGILWILPESVTNWDKEEMRNYGMFQRWVDNVSAGPIWDNDAFYLNWIMHPWAGGIYYMNARGSGFNQWQSFAYSAFMSTFLWEYGVEAFAEIPSWQDLFITPILGSILGEQFFRWKGKIIRNGKKILNSRFLGGTALIIMDPFNQLLDSFGYKTKNKIQTYSAIAPIDYDINSKKAIWGLQVVVTF